MILSVFTLFHVLISLVGIAAGFVVLFGLINSKHLSGWTSLFLATTAATSATGFFFPYHGFEPSYVVGTISLVVLGFAYLALYRFHLEGAWRRTYVISTTVALYFNVFVLVVQLFRKVPALNALAPTQTEPPFAIAQITVLLIFIALGTLATIKFRGASLRTA